MPVACPKCGSRDLRPSRARNFSEKLGKLRLVLPLRCRDCKARFIAPTFLLADLVYARCPACLRMDLSGWPGNSHTDLPFWVALKISFGAKKWRCEYCRLNFASFRERKEVFTFKRWKQFVPKTEAPAAPADVERSKASSGSDV
jgi:DNA-directed RNA polymerase subunit RPC12/RpoP